VAQNITITGPAHKVWRSNASSGHLEVRVNGVVTQVPINTPTTVSDSVHAVLTDAGIQLTVS